MRHLREGIICWFWLAAFHVIGVAGQAYGKVCDISVKATDDIVFDSADIKIEKGCKKLRIHFKHSGSVLKHNWVLVRKSDLARIRKEGEVAGEPTGFLPKDGKGVIAQTKLLEPGSDENIEIEVSNIKRGVEYVYFCSFPGHGATMKGVLRFAAN